MAKLNKDQYFARGLAAGRRMNNNSEILVDNGISEDVADLLSELCTIRHNIHSSIDRMVYRNESGYLEDLIRINGELKDKGFAIMDFCPTNTDCFINIDDIYIREEIEGMNSECEGYQDWYDDAYRDIYRQYEELNRKIEGYLADIDKKYDTNYCPSGAQRIM